MKHLLAQLVAGNPLTPDQAVEAFELIMTGQSTPAQTGALLAMIEQRGATVDELAGAATVMRQKVRCVDVPAGLRVIDTCGTGGDHAGTFNISTAAALVAAGAGLPHGVAVAKHGNRSVTSNSGSSQVLEALGVKLQVTPDTLGRCLEEAGLCFCFAPAHHPAMKHAAPIRAELGFRTMFNVLGPLTNPAGATRQLIGVFTTDMTKPIAAVLQRLGAEHAMVVHGQIPDDDGQHVDGLDELSTCGPSQISEVRDGKVKTYEIDPDDLGLSYSHPKALKADSPDASAALIRKLLAGEPGPPRDIVILNAAAALVVADLAADLAEGLEQAVESIDTGAAKQALDHLVEITTADPTPVG
ncbi:MAG: anthranilate phosphoribosyltransferase [Phycisphaeraceae bacterium]